MQDVPRAERKRIRKAFEAFTAMCEAYRPVWGRDGSSNQAMARLLVSVELLYRAETIIEPIPAQYYRRDMDLVKLVNRLDQFYEHLEVATYTLALAPEAVRTLPPRSAMPTATADFLSFAERVGIILQEHAELFTRVGLSTRMVSSFSNAVQRCIAQQEERVPLWVRRQTVGTMSTYQRQLNACLRNLLESVDLIVPRYREHKRFQRAYTKARARLMALPIMVRYTFHVDGVGKVSGVHRDAFKPWPGELGNEEYPTSDELKA